MQSEIAATIEHAWGCHEVAEAFDVLILRVRRWTREGRLPAAQVPGYRGRYLFDPVVLRPLATAWLTQHALPARGTYRPDTAP